MKPKNSQDVVEGADYYGNRGNKKPPAGKEPMSMLVKVGIGVAVIGVIAFVVWKMRKKGRK